MVRAAVAIMGSVPVLWPDEQRAFPWEIFTCVYLKSSSHVDVCTLHGCEINCHNLFAVSVSKLFLPALIKAFLPSFHLTEVLSS